MNYTKYQLEGTSNPVNVTLAIGIGLIVALFLGWLYNLTFLIPLIYFNFIITIGFGFVIAIFVQIISKFLKIRERKTRLIMVTILLVVAYYSHWIAYILYISSGTIPSLSNFLSYWIYPQNFFAIIGEINTYGTWSLGFSSETPVRGIVLTLIWLAEAAIIFFLAINYILKFPENPFSEQQNKWFPKLTLDKEFVAFFSADVFMKEIRDGGTNFILKADKGRANKYSEISIFYLPNENNQYLTVDTISIDSKKGSNKEVTPIITPIKISNEEAKQLMDAFGTKKPFFLEF